MEDYKLEELKPFEFFKWFKEICKIPHGSKNERKLIEFLIEFAKKRNVYFDVDKKGNVFMKLPASVGYEAQPSILFQAHLDMVCVKDEGVEFDFNKDPIKLEITGDKLHAKGTSLGADNAVGIATMLAIADSKDIVHPPLEFLFTVEEEIGLNGIREFDVSKITARQMINMDCGDSHVLAVCSTGKRGGSVEHICETEQFNKEYRAMKIIVSGCKGGHASINIRNGLADAVTCIGELLTAVSDLPVKLCNLKTFGVALFSKAEAEVVFPDEIKEQVIDVFNNCFEGIKSVYSKVDPDLCLEMTDAVAPSIHLTKRQTDSVVSLLGLVKSSVYREDVSDNRVITFNVLNEVSLVGNKFELSFFVRSFNEYDMTALYNFYVKTSKFLGFDINSGLYYSAWMERENSALREKFVKVHDKLFGTLPTFERVQGGVEQADITSRIKDMDAIGVAPTARGAHTTKEHLFISEVPDFWNWLTAVLKEKE